MQHEALVLFSTEGLHPLLISFAAQRSTDQSLSFTSGEQGGSVGARQVAGFTADRTNLVEGSTVYSSRLIDDFGAHRRFTVFREQLRNFA